MNTEDKVKPLRGYSDNPEFYVYIHHKLDGTIFYVGKGKGNRAWSKKCRNRHWKYVVTKYPDYVVEIIQKEMIEQDAFVLEQSLISSIGLDNLTNQVLGGISTTGYKHTDKWKKQQSINSKKNMDSVSARENLSKKMKEHWQNLPVAEHNRRSNEFTQRLTSPDARSKMLEAKCVKIVVNRQYVFESRVQFYNITGTNNKTLDNAENSAKKFEFSFTVTNGLFIEHFDEQKHADIPYYNGEKLTRLNFDTLPRSKAVVMDESMVFLSMNEAANFCDLKATKQTASYITTRIKQNKPALGHLWRVATNLEIADEIFKRLDLFTDKFSKLERSLCQQ